MNDWRVKYGAICQGHPEYEGDYCPLCQVAMEHRAGRDATAEALARAEERIAELERAGDEMRRLILLWLDGHDPGGDVRPALAAWTAAKEGK